MMMGILAAGVYALLPRLRRNKMLQTKSNGFLLVMVSLQMCLKLRVLICCKLQLRYAY